MEKNAMKGDSIVYEFEIETATGILFDWNTDLRI